MSEQGTEGKQANLRRVGNAAYIYISIAFIQMLKALMVVAVYGFGVLLGTEVLTGRRLLNVLVISFGVIVASYGGAALSVAPLCEWLLAGYLGITWLPCRGAGELVEPRRTCTLCLCSGSD